MKIAFFLLSLSIFAKADLTHEQRLERAKAIPLAQSFYECRKELQDVKVDGELREVDANGSFFVEMARNVHQQDKSFFVVYRAPGKNGKDQYAFLEGDRSKITRNQKMVGELPNKSKVAFGETSFDSKEYLVGRPDCNSDPKAPKANLDLKKAENKDERLTYAVITYLSRTLEREFGPHAFASTIGSSAANKYNASNATKVTEAIENCRDFIEGMTVKGEAMEFERKKLMAEMTNHLSSIRQSITKPSGGEKGLFDPSGVIDPSN